MSSNKTKDWLKNQLVSHGVPLPSSTAKKEEYQRLYEEQVLPRQNSTEFSSDDDAEDVSPQDTPARSPPSVQNSSRTDTKTQNGTDGSTDKRTAWVRRLSDKNLFTALKANGKEVGGIVESTRMLYQNMLVEMLKKDEQKSISDIENYLTQNEEARKEWLEGGAELNGGFNGVTNGNSENGYSDTDDDDTVETASRASRSSRASSKRVTPIRSSAPSPPVKESTPTHRTVADSNVKSRRLTGVLDDINEVDGDQGVTTASPARSTFMSDNLLYNRVSSPSDSSLRFNKPYTVRKNVVETIEKTRTYVYDDEDSKEDVHTQPQRRNSPIPKPGGSRAIVLVKYILLLIAILVVPVLGYYIFQVRSDNSTSCEGPDCASTDELDVLLQELHEKPEPAEIPIEG